MITKRSSLLWAAPALVATLAAVGCASNPNDIAPQNVSAAQYNNYSCTELGIEYRRLNQGIASTSDDFRPVRLGDIYGYIPVGPVSHFPMPVGSMMSTDRTTLIAYLKGEREATMRMAVAKGCPGATSVPIGYSDFILR